MSRLPHYVFGLRFIPVLLGVALAGCGSSDSASGSPSDAGDGGALADTQSPADTHSSSTDTGAAFDAGPPPTLSVYDVDDHDRRSAVGATDPRIVIRQTKSADHPTAIVDEVGAKLVLRTWPELTPVTGHAVKDATTEGPGLLRAGDVDFITNVSFHADGMLGDRWYLLSVAGAPSDWAIALRPQPGGEQGIRFRPGSDPLLSKMYIEAGTEKGKVYIGFTEEVASDDVDIATLVKLTQPGHDTKCFAFGGSPPELGLSCQLDPTLSLTVTIEAGLHGKALPAKPVAPHVYDFSSVAEANGFGI